jgi:HAD superfamily hydrolase (TIGR01484 family)
MLLAFDLDGTLVTRQFTLPDATREAVRAAERAGHAVTVVTGRCEASTRRYLEALGVSRPYATCHGARVALRSGRVLLHSALPSAVVEDLVARHREARLGLHAGLSTYVVDPDDACWAWERAEGFELVPLHRYAGEAVTKAVLRRAPGMLEALRARHGGVTLYASLDHVEVIAAEAHKGEALRLIAAELGFAREDVIAFGDGENDASMLAWAGHAVSVGDAVDAARAAAHEHVAAPEALGVAGWIDAHLLRRAV